MHKYNALELNARMKSCKGKSQEFDRKFYLDSQQQKIY